MRRYDPQFWKGLRQGTSACVSVVVHVALITLSVIGTLPAPDVPSGSFANRVYYIPPPNREPPQTASREKLHYVELAPPGEGAGFGLAAMRSDRAAVASHGPDTGNAGRDSVATPAADASEGQDSVFTIVEVDTVATRLPESAAPQYPKAMLEQKIQGSVVVQFVVDTTGRADVESLKILLTSRQEFAESIRDALPEMRFSAARIGTMKVRQLVELPFSFHIAEPQPLPPVETKVTRRRP